MLRAQNSNSDDIGVQGNLKPSKSNQYNSTLLEDCSEMENINFSKSNFSEKTTSRS